MVYVDECMYEREREKVDCLQGVCMKVREKVDCVHGVCR